MQQFEAYKYRNELSWRNKLARLAWVVVSAVLFRWTPRYGFNEWRNVLLRLFGATVGKGCKIHPRCRIWAPWNLELGTFVSMAEDVDCYCVSPIQIGSKVAISQRAFLCTASHDISTHLRPLIHKPIVIEDFAWVCAEAFVGPGVRVGEGAVIAARGCVFRDVEPYAVMMGNPATMIKKRVIKS